MTVLARRLALVGALSVLVVSASACSGGDDSATDDETSDSTTAQAASVAPTQPPTSGEPPTSDSTDETPPATTTPAGDGDDVDDAAATQPPPVALIAGIAPTVELLTPESGSGIRPQLAWSPVDGGSYYLATVYAPDGTPYWTWTGTATAVHVGGDPVLDDDRPGPSVVDGMSWGVVALDDQIVPIALSDRRPIAP
jgi:hypothetical protein